MLSNKVRRLRTNFRRMLENELAKLDEDEFDVIKELDDGEFKAVEEEITTEDKAPTRIIDKKDLADATEEFKSLEDELAEPATDMKEATLSDLSESLKKMAEEPASISDTIILK